MKTASNRSKDERMPLEINKDELGDGFGPFGSHSRYESARADFESGKNVVSWKDVRAKMIDMMRIQELKGG